MEVMMFRTLTLAAIVLGSVALSVPVYAAERGSEAGDGFNRAKTDPVVSGFARSYETGPNRLPHRDGLDGDRYWSDGDCFPTAPGACD
jgi:hypothetical protein